MDQNGRQLLFDNESKSSITDIFNEGLKMQRQNITKLLSSNFKLAMEEKNFWKRISRSESLGPKENIFEEKFENVDKSR